MIIISRTDPASLTMTSIFLANLHLKSEIRDLLNKAFLLYSPFDPTRGWFITIIDDTNKLEYPIRECWISYLRLKCLWGNHYEIYLDFCTWPFKPCTKLYFVNKSGMILVKFYPSRLFTDILRRYKRIFLFISNWNFPLHPVTSIYANIEAKTLEKYNVYLFSFQTTGNNL